MSRGSTSKRALRAALRLRKDDLDETMETIGRLLESAEEGGAPALEIVQRLLVLSFALGIDRGLDEHQLAALVEETTEAAFGVVDLAYVDVLAAEAAS